MKILGKLRRAKRTEHGTMALEMVILAPILLILFMFLLACGRYFQTSSLLENAARDGARAASQSRSSKSPLTVVGNSAIATPSSTAASMEAKGVSVTGLFSHGTGGPDGRPFGLLTLEPA